MKRTRQEKTMVEKVELLNRFKALPPLSQREAAEKLGISRGFLQNLLKNEAAICAEDQGSSAAKRKRAGKDQDVEDALYEWFKFARSKNVPVNGPIIMQKANNIAVDAGHDDFKATDGWFSRWKKRYGITFTTLKGKVSSLIAESLKDVDHVFISMQVKQRKPTSVEQRSFVTRSWQIS